MYNRSISIKTIHSIVPDLGHSKTCSRCGAGHGIRWDLIGKERYLTIEMCEPCTKRPPPKKAPAKPWIPRVER